MKPFNIKYALIVFGIGMVMSFQTNAQQLCGSYQPMQNMRKCISNASVNQAGTIFFASSISSLWSIKPSPSVFNANSFLPDSTDHIMVINGPVTPKDAVFCQFENRLWKSFDIGIRLRVETPPHSH